MTTYHLQFWSKYSDGRQIVRLYVNDDARNSLGYIERRIDERARHQDNYYDAHRVAKGDLYEVVADRITVAMDAAPFTALLLAVDDRAPAGAKPLADADDMDRFLRLQTFARGVGWATNARKLNKQANEFTFEFTNNRPW